MTHYENSREYIINRLVRSERAFDEGDSQMAAWFMGDALIWAVMAVAAAVRGVSDLPVPEATPTTAEPEDAP